MSFLFVITCSLLKVHQSTSFIGRGKEEGFGIYFKQLLVSYMYGLGLFCFLGAGNGNMLLLGLHLEFQFLQLLEKTFCGSQLEEALTLAVVLRL